MEQSPEGAAVPVRCDGESLEDIAEPESEDQGRCEARDRHDPVPEALPSGGIVLAAKLDGDAPKDEGEEDQEHRQEQEA